MNATMQIWLVGLLVAGCFFYAAWVLMPAALRRWLAGWLLRFRWPAVVARALARQAQAGAACRCGGCEQSVGKGVQTQAAELKFHPRRKTGT